VGYFSNASMTATVDGFLGEYNVFSNPGDMQQIFPTYDDYYSTSPAFVFASLINFDIEEKFPWKGARTANQFIAQWTGTIHILVGGVYTFRLTSDDGSWIWIGNNIVVNHGGIHPFSPKDANTNLQPGYHKTVVRFYD